MFSRQQSPVPAAGGVDEDQGVALLSRVLAAVSDAGTDQAVVDAAVDAVQGAVGWEAVRGWRVDSGAGVLVPWPGAGRSATDAARPPDSVTLAKGQGVIGQAWARNDLVLADDLAGATRQASGAATARELRSSLGVPLAEHGRVVGVLEFSSVTPWRPSPERMQLMRTIGVVVSQALERVATADLAAERGKDMAAVNAVLREITTAGSETAAIQVALDTIRREFGWEYGSYWSLDPAERVLRNAVESGNAGEEFRQVTRAATFAEGVGVAGRAWKGRDMVFEPDLGGVKDCVRAPAAQRAGVKSGVCLPIIVHGDVVGTMDFFTTRSIHLSAAREDALRNTAFLVSNAIEQTRGKDRVSTAGEELLSSITEVERNVIEASNVAADAQRLTEEASKIVASLNTSSVEIGNVVKVITSIAEQTNLLALNATIEAARAGDSGKGFAVVASEVKDLARDTAKATEEVDSKVSAIQSDANSVVQALEGVARTVARINEAQDMISGVLTEQSAVTRSVLSQ